MQELIPTVSAHPFNNCPNTIYQGTNLKNYESEGLLLQRA
jgi:hypothetical protein